MRKFALLLLLLCAAASAPAEAKLRVFACETDWAALTRELAGDLVSVDTATTALQDVHVVEAKPSLIAKVRNGGSGNWGQIPMPPHGPDKISDADLKAAIEWILKL